MDSKRILITGGAGFIGSHLTDALLKKGHEITIYDNLDPQVHGIIGTLPDYMATNVKFIKADIRDRNSLSSAIQDHDVIYHLAAAVGVAQSMYKIHKFVDVNSTGTANLLDILANENHNIQKLIVASSMSTYGEGAIQCADCGIVYPEIRMHAPDQDGNWELHCPHCDKIGAPIPTPETRPQDCTTIYALTKMEQEKMSLMMGKTYGINTTALRFFGVYGSRQALSNPYTGVCAIFSTSLLAGNPPLIYEDGKQSRDLIHVQDICQGLTLAMERPEAQDEVFNVGTGESITIMEVAQILATKLNPHIKPKVTGQFRAGDVRHIVGDITKIKQKLGFNPQFHFKDGIEELLDWIKNVDKSQISDKSKEARAELEKKGLI